MPRQPSNYHVAIYGAPKESLGEVAGGSHRLKSLPELQSWIKENEAMPHPNGDHYYGILPDGRAFQIFHGHTESLITKVEIG